MRKNENSIPVWDPFIRFFHWSLALTYLVSWASAEEMWLLHEKTGYFILILIGLRSIWGMAGSRHARFSDFIYSPQETLTYLRSMIDRNAKSYAGHNPAGGWMVILIITSLAVTAATGIQIAGTHDSLWEEAHEIAASLTLLLVMLHIGGVLIASRMHSENLVKSMLTGKKVRRENDV